MNSQKIWSGDGGWWGKIFSRNLAMSYKKPWRFPPWKILIFWSQVTYPTPGSRWRKKGQDFVVPKRLHPGSDVTVLVNKRVCWLINVCVCVCVCVFSLNVGSTVKNRRCVVVVVVVAAAVDDTIWFMLSNPQLDKHETNIIPSQSDGEKT